MVFLCVHYAFIIGRQKSRGLKEHRDEISRMRR